MQLFEARFSPSCAGIDVYLSEEIPESVRRLVKLLLVDHVGEGLFAVLHLNVENLKGEKA